MEKLVFHQQIAAPSCKVWEIIYDEFAQIEFWSTFMYGSLDIEARTKPKISRYCNSRLGNYIEEVINLQSSNCLIETIFKPESGALTCVRTQMKVNKWSVNTSTLNLTVQFQSKSYFRFLNFYFKRRLASFYKTTLNDLKFYAETDRRSNSKIESTARFKN